MTAPLPVEDRHAIEDLFARYSWALDTGDPEGLAATFAPDGKCIEEVFEEPDIWEGREGVAAMGRHYMSSPNFPGRQHHLTMPLYQPVAPDRCTVRSFVFVTETRGEPPMVLRFSGHYFDDIVKRDGEWMFFSRLIRMWDGEVLKNFPGKGEWVARKRPEDLIVRHD